MKLSRCFSLLIAIVLVISLAACATDPAPPPAGGGSAAAPATPGGGAPAAVTPVTITMWSNDAHNRDEYFETIENFHRTRGAELGITVEYTVHGGDWQQVLDVAIQAGQEPHIFKSQRTPMYVEMGRLFPIADLPNGPDMIASNEGLHQEGIGMINGVIYKIPLRVVTYGLIYNRELLAEVGFDRAPETWEELVEAARLITEAPGPAYGYALPLPFANFPLHAIMPSAVVSSGQLHFDFRTGQYDFMSMAPFFNMVRQIVDDGSMFPGIESLDYDMLRAHFAEGNIGMYPGASFDVGVLYDQFPARIDWGVAPHPVPAGTQRFRQNALPVAFFAISNRIIEENVIEQTGIVYELFVSAEHLALTYERGKDIPIRPDIVPMAGTPVRPQWIDFANLDNTFNNPPFPEANFAIEGDTFYTIFSRIITGVVSVEAGLADLDTRYNAALQRAINDGTIDLDAILVHDWDNNVRFIP